MAAKTMKAKKLKGELVVHGCDEEGCDKTWTKGGSMGTRTDGKVRCPMHFFRYLRGVDSDKPERVKGAGPRKPVMFRPTHQVAKALAAWVKKERRNHPKISQGELVERAVVAELSRLGFVVVPPHTGA